MPNSVGKGFHTAMKTGLPRHYDTPQPISEFQDSFPLPRIRINQDKKIRIKVKATLTYVQAFFVRFEGNSILP